MKKAGIVILFVLMVLSCSPATTNTELLEDATKGIQDDREMRFLEIIREQNQDFMLNDKYLSTSEDKETVLGAIYNKHNEIREYVIGHYCIAQRGDCGSVRVDIPQTVTVGISQSVLVPFNVTRVDETEGFYRITVLASYMEEEYQQVLDVEVINQ